MTGQKRSLFLISACSAVSVLILIIVTGIFISRNNDDSTIPTIQVPAKEVGPETEIPLPSISASSPVPTDKPGIRPTTPYSIANTKLPVTSEPSTPITPTADLPVVPVCRYVKVHLDDPADAKDLTRLANLGLKLLDKLDKRVWYACITSVGSTEPSTIEGVESLELIEPADKLSARLKTDPSVQEWEVRPGNHRAFAVLFHKGVPATEVLQLAADFGFELEGFSAEAFDVTRIVTIIVDPGGLEKLIAAGIVSFVDTTPPPSYPNNNNIGQQLSDVNVVHKAPFNLDGTGVTVGVWDGGPILTTHADLSPRINVAANQVAGVSGHATHVAGTIASSGANRLEAQGMAPNAKIESYDSGNDNQEILTASRSTGVPARVQLSNHSYSTCIGWESRCANPRRWIWFPDDRFGAYDITSVVIDSIVSNTGIISAYSAGNWQNRGPGGNQDRTKPNGCTAHRYDNFAHAPGVFADCIAPKNGAKNVITVGAMSDANRVAPFSSYGPMDDGRIKPDIVAAGNPLLSTWADGNYGSISGTSMSTPLVTGIGTLIVQDAMTNMNSFSSPGFPFRRIWTPMTPEGMKALLIQTADDVHGFQQATVGPDYATGWGIANAEKAITLLRKGGLTQGKISATGQDNAWSRTFNVTGTEPEIHMTLAWSDPSGNTAAVKALVNDLDLRLIDPSGNNYTPWILPGGMADPTRSAVRNGGNDDINNVEQVSVLNPGAGRWTARVTASDLDPTTVPQIFALAGLLPDDPDTILSPIRLLP